MQMLDMGPGQAILSLAYDMEIDENKDVTHKKVRNYFLMKQSLKMLENRTQSRNISLYQGHSAATSPKPGLF